MGFEHINVLYIGLLKLRFGDKSKNEVGICSRVKFINTGLASVQAGFYDEVVVRLSEL